MAEVEGAIIESPLETPDPGVYIAAATTPAYGWLKALTVEGGARFLGERYDVDGTKLIAVSIPGAALAANQRAVRCRKALRFPARTTAAAWTRTRSRTSFSSAARRRRPAPAARPAASARRRSS